MDGITVPRVKIRERGIVLYLGWPRKFRIYHTDALA